MKTNTKHLKFFGIGKILPFLKHVRWMILTMVALALVSANCFCALGICALAAFFTNVLAFVSGLWIELVNQALSYHLFTLKNHVLNGKRCRDSVSDENWCGYPQNRDTAVGFVIESVEERVLHAKFGNKLPAELTHQLAVLEENLK